jgi:CheY-like chemotaxis protein
MAPIDSPFCVTRARSKETLSAIRPPSAGGPLAGCRILVVHDSPDVTSALSDIFTAAGARGVAAAHDGPEANVLLAWGGYDLVFLDATAPGAEDVLRLIQESMPNLLSRTVVLTADLRDGHDATARLRSSYPTALFHGSWLVDLVGIAARAIQSTARRAVA